MADIKKIKLPSGSEYNIKDSRITAIESTLTSSSTNIPTSSAVKSYADSILPLVSAADNGKILGVAEGAWAAVSIIDADSISY